MPAQQPDSVTLLVVVVQHALCMCQLPHSCTVLWWRVNSVKALGNTLYLVTLLIPGADGVMLMPVCLCFFASCRFVADNPGTWVSILWYLMFACCWLAGWLAFLAPCPLSFIDIWTTCSKVPALALVCAARLRWLLVAP
jgi:hypothetical protein